MIPSVVAATAILLAACTGDVTSDPPPAADGPQVVATPVPAVDDGDGSPVVDTEAEPDDTDPDDDGVGAEPTTEPAPLGASDTRPDTGEPAGPLVTLSDVRLGRHDGFDRVVLQMDGGGRAGWDVRYVDDPRGQATGDPVDVAGDAVLEVILTGTGYPDDTGVAFYSGPSRIDGPGQAVVEVSIDSSFEGRTQLFIGTSGERPFRVRWFDGRVVIDVAER